MQVRIALLLAVLASAGGVLADDSPPSVYVESIACTSGPYGLRLPKTLPLVKRLAPIEREEILEVEQWDGYTATRKYLYFPGLALGVVEFSNDPLKYLVSAAQISQSRWRVAGPFVVGGSIHSAQRALGKPAQGDPQLRSEYGGESASIRFEAANGKLVKVTYDCYTG